ncbi:cytochrome P450 9e2-like [Neodiprion fabricii]|uniref:cytochrome P450 9e2-like n=1 Tax=Neodiprion fabricii TaxID=2872261 RepID=UPI001ED8F2BE|nr:cytochrome P450 9e2-like [Neodiprion fabricii]
MECCSTLLLSVLAGLVGVYYLVCRKMNYFKRKGIPYVKGIPFIGNMSPAVFKQMSFAENVQRLYNAKRDVKYVGIFEFMNPVVMLRDPELIRSVTIKNFDNFQDHRNFIDEVLDPLFAKNLFFLQGERWRDMRSLLSPAFTSSKMKMMFKLVSQCGGDLADYLIAKASLEPIEVEMKDIFTRYTNDVIATSAFGITVNSLKDRDNEFYTMGKKATTFSGMKTIRIFIVRSSSFLAKLFSIRIIETNVRKFFSNVIESNIAMRDSQGIVRNDMIHLMLQARDKSDKIKLSVEDMTAQAFIFFFGGFDTSSTLMSFAAHEVAINPEIQDKLRAEIDAVLEVVQGELTYEALHGMRYLDAVMNEALRLYPPAAMVDRLCNKAFELPPAAPGLAPLTLKPGDNIWLPIHGLHRDPEYFSEPEKFQPERFSDENKNKIPTFAFLPFGLGPRSCIGNRFALMEAKLALFHLVAKCILSPCTKTSIPIQLDKQDFNTTAENGFWLTIQRRS